MVRYSANGTCEGVVTTSFSYPFANDYATSVAINPNNDQIVVAGYTYDFNNGGMYDFAVAAYNADGSPDTSFGTDGQVMTLFPPGSISNNYNMLPLSAFANSVAFQPDGQIVAAGWVYDPGTRYVPLVWLGTTSTAHWTPVLATAAW